MNPVIVVLVFFSFVINTRRGFKRPYNEEELCLGIDLIDENIEYLKTTWFN